MRIMSKIGTNAFEHFRRAALRSAPSSSRCQRDMSLRIPSHCISARRTLRCRRNGLSRCFVVVSRFNFLLPTLPGRSAKQTLVFAAQMIYQRPRRPIASCLDVVRADFARLFDDEAALSQPKASFELGHTARDKMPGTKQKSKLPRKTPGMFPGLRSIAGACRSIARSPPRLGCRVVLGGRSRSHNDRVVVRIFGRYSSDDGDINFITFIRTTKSLAPSTEDVLGCLSVLEDQRERRRLAWPIAKKGGRMPAGFLPKMYVDDRPNRYVPVIAVLTLSSRSSVLFWETALMLLSNHRVQRRSISAAVRGRYSAFANAFLSSSRETIQRNDDSCCPLPR